MCSGLLAAASRSTMGNQSILTCYQLFGYQDRLRITSNFEPESCSHSMMRYPSTNSISSKRREALGVVSLNRGLETATDAQNYISRRNLDLWRKSGLSGREADWRNVACSNMGIRDTDRKLLEQKHEIRICINKTCRKSGSLETLEIMRSLAPPNVAVESCSCIGKCGAGPNLVILPAELMVSHCNTAAHAARLLALQCGAANPENNLKALALKQQANKAFERGCLLEAEQLYSEAIQLQPTGGLHYIFANRSALRLAQGNHQGALDDAQEAENIAPQWAQAHVRQADVLSAMEKVRPALIALSTALHLDPSLRRSKGFQAKLLDLEGKLATAGAST